MTAYVNGPEFTGAVVVVAPEVDVSGSVVAVVPASVVLVVASVVAVVPGSVVAVEAGCDVTVVSGCVEVGSVVDGPRVVGLVPDAPVAPVVVGPEGATVRSGSVVELEPTVVVLLEVEERPSSDASAVADVVSELPVVPSADVPSIARDEGVGADETRLPTKLTAAADNDTAAMVAAAQAMMGNIFRMGTGWLTTGDTLVMRRLSPS